MPTILGERFPEGMTPGDTVTWTELNAVTRSGMVIDRAANGLGQGSCEGGGYWLWVLTDDDEYVRIRTWASGKRRGEAVRDDGPMWRRSRCGRGSVYRP